MVFLVTHIFMYVCMYVWVTLSSFKESAMKQGKSGKSKKNVRHVVRLHELAEQEKGADEKRL